MVYLSNRPARDVEGGARQRDESVAEARLAGSVGVCHAAAAAGGEDGVVPDSRRIVAVVLAVFTVLVAVASVAVVRARRPSHEQCRQRYEAQLGREVGLVGVEWRWLPWPRWRCVEIFDL